MDAICRSFLTHHIKDLYEVVGHVRYITIILRSYYPVTQAEHMGSAISDWEETVRKQLHQSIPFLFAAI